MNDRLYTLDDGLGIKRPAAASPLHLTTDGLWLALTLIGDYRAGGEMAEEWVGSKRVVVVHTTIKRKSKGDYYQRIPDWFDTYLAKE